MSLIADALRKAESTPGGATPPPPSPRSLWVYRALLATSVVGVLVGLGWAATRHPGSRPPQKVAQTKPIVEAPSKPIGNILLQTAQKQWALTGIIQGGNGKALALIDNQVVEEGQTFRGAKVVRVAADRVDLEEEGRIRTLRLPD